MRWRAVFVDIDNTLLDFDAYVKQTMREGFSYFGLVPYEEWMYDCFTEENNKLWRRIEEGTLVFAELEKIRWNTVFQRLGIVFDGPVFEKYFRAKLRECAIPIDGAYVMLQELKGNTILCAASNGPFEQQVHRLEIAKMDQFFDYIFISEDIGASKPSKLFFDRAFERINKDYVKAGDNIIDPRECLMIGDSMSSDIVGGKQVGMQTYFFAKKGSYDSITSGEPDMPDEIFTNLVNLTKRLHENLQNTV